MKRTKQILSLALCAILLVSATVATTVAYLTSQDAVTNTFTVGKVAITLDEQDVDDTDKDQNTTERDKENSYKILPGQTYTKDPIIHVSNEDGTEDCYLFVKVTDEIKAIQADKTVETQMLEKGWEKLDGVADVWYWTGDANATTITEKQTVVSKGTDVDVFDNFKIADSVDNVELAKYAGKTIVVKAYAIQVAGFEDKTPVEIWEAADFE